MPTIQPSPAPAPHTLPMATPPSHALPPPVPGTSSLAHYQIIRRNGAVVPFEPPKIAVAMMKAFLAVHGTQGAVSASVRDAVEALTHTVVRALLRSRPHGGTGITALMAANLRDGVVWRTMSRNAAVQRGFDHAGFKPA